MSQGTIGAARERGRWEGRTGQRNRAIAIDVAAGIRTLDGIAREYGVSRERIRQIAARAGVSRNGVPTPAKPRTPSHIPHPRGPLPCRACGEIVPFGQMRDHRRRPGHHYVQRPQSEKDPSAVRRGRLGARARWGVPRRLSLAGLSDTQRERILDLVAQVRRDMLKEA